LYRETQQEKFQKKTRKSWTRKPRYAKSNIVKQRKPTRGREKMVVDPLAPKPDLLDAFVEELISNRNLRLALGKVVAYKVGPNGIVPIRAKDFYK
jgi:hypothetical protein